MNWTIQVAKRFLKDLSRLPSKVRARVEDFVFEKLPATEKPLELMNRLKGYPQFFKVRFGDYRVGIGLDDQNKELHVLRVLHRREIYRHFP